MKGARDRAKGTRTPKGEKTARGRETTGARSHFVPQLSPRQCYDCTVCSFGVWHGVGWL